MGVSPILTVAVPAYNMEAYLERNLLHFSDSRLIGKLEVICINNSSQDKTEQIATRFCAEEPELFSLITKENRGYGPSINLAIQKAAGTYFKIVDADDWVETEELVKLVQALEDCFADAVFTDYDIVDASAEKKLPVAVKAPKLEYGKVYTDLNEISRSLPPMHATCYRTEILKREHVELQEDTGYVDEEFVTLPYLYIKSYVFFPFSVYQYRLGDAAQSVSPKNRGRYFADRERVLKRLISVYCAEASKGAEDGTLGCLYERIKKGSGDHFTTLYMYIQDRKTGRKLAQEWKAYLRDSVPKVWADIRIKKSILQILNAMNISLVQYETLKRLVLRNNTVAYQLLGKQFAQDRKA